MPPPSYATRADLVSLSISEAALQKVSSDDVEVQLEAASRLADSYLIKRFTLPLTAWGNELKKAVCDLAAYSLIKVRGFNPQKSDGEQLRDGHNDSIKWLKDVGSGAATPIGIVDSGGGENNTDAAGEALSRPFVMQATTEETLDGGFWDREGGTRTTDGTPRKRGW